jgi:MFS family permease
MAKTQLLLFSLVLFLMFGSGSGFVTLVPVHLSRLGIPSDQIGYFFSVLYLGMAGSSILAGWLADRFGRHKWMCNLSAAGAIFASSLMLIGAQSFPIFAIGMFLGWFLAGIHSALVSTLVGLQARQSERGRVFGIIGFITGLGPVMSGFFFGKIMDSYGFETLLILNVVIPVIWTVLSLFYRVPASPPPKPGPQPARAPFPLAFYWIILAATLGWLSVNGGKLGITLAMTLLSFSADEISLTVGVASLIALAMPLWLGWLSDLVGRKPLLLGLNLIGLAGLWIISQAQDLIGFCIASSLLSVYSCFGSLANAFITDLAPPESIGTALALVNGTSFIAGIFSSTLVGTAVNTWGNQTPFLFAMVFPLVAGLLLVRIGENRQKNIARSY